jgi:uncharacterized protein YecE (DUF72 family)
MASLDAFITTFNAFVEFIPSGYEYGLEIRNPNYLKTPYFEFLNDHDLIPVFLHGYYMPPVWEVVSQHEELIRKSTVIRLHGPDRKGIEESSGGKWNRIIVSRDDELDAVSRIIQKMTLRDIDVWLNVNNHFEGSAPLTIKRLQERLNASA